MGFVLNGTEPNVAGYWNFNDGTVRDSSPHANDGVFEGKEVVVEAELLLLAIVPAVELILPANRLQRCCCNCNITPI